MLSSLDDRSIPSLAERFMYLKPNDDDSLCSAAFYSGAEIIMHDLDFCEKRINVSLST